MANYLIQPLDGVSYTADLWRQMLASYGAADHAKAGILPGPLNGLTVDRVSGTMQVVVRKGSAFVNGRWVHVDADETLILSAPDLTDDRYDLVVFRTNKSAGTSVLAVKEGTPAASPTIPALDQTDDPLYEIPIALVRVRGTVSVLQDHAIKPYYHTAHAAAQQVVLMYNTSATQSVWRGYPVRKTYDTTAANRGLTWNAFGVEPWDPDGDYPIFGVALQSFGVGQWGPVLTKGPVWLPYYGDLNPEVGQLVSPRDMTPSAEEDGWPVVRAGTWPIGYAMETATYQTGLSYSPYVLVYVDNAISLQPRIWRRVDDTTGPINGGAAGSWQTVLPWTIQVAYQRTQWVRVRFQGSLSHDSAGSLVQLTIRVNGVDQEPMWVAHWPGTNRRVTASIDRLIDIGAAFQAMNYQLRWKYDAITPTLYADATMPVMFSVEEVFLSGHQDPPHF